MPTAAQCQALAKEYKDLAQEPGIPADQAAQLNKIVRSFKGLATELDMLAAKYAMAKGRCSAHIQNARRGALADRH
jgi:hypothetical protein